MKKTLFTIIAAALLLSACNGAKSTHPGPVIAGPETQVETVYGTVEGYLDSGVYTFLGIKYADAERFMPPVAPQKFEGVRMCKVYGPQAPQNESLVWTGDTQRDYVFGNNFVIEKMDEKECLVLNVWTKGINDGGKRPVFVWIHGGGYSGGSAHDLPCYEGSGMASNGDLVYVSLNHRLNVLGFVDLTALGGKYTQSVNLGMQDIVKALEWIRDNIDKFGGDPGNVTIAGQSGGGGKVSTLLAMPSAHGLFHRACIQSGSTIRQTESEVAREGGLRFVEALGLKPTADADFSGFSYDELVAASRVARASGSPVVDGVILPVHPFDPTAPEISRDVPVMVGCNFNEMIFDVNIDTDWDRAVATLAQRMGQEKAEAYRDAFRKAYPGAEARDMLIVETRTRPRVLEQATLRAEMGGADTYVYQFNWFPENNALGASHGMELPFMHYNVITQREMTGSSDSAYALEKIVGSYWINFARTGNPNGKGLPEWKPFKAGEGGTMILDNDCHMAYNHDAEFLQAAAL